MALSVRHFGELLGEDALSRMASKVGLQPRPLSARKMILEFGLPLQPTHLALSWLEGDFPKHPVKHAPNSKNVPVNAEGGVTLEWEDSGKGSQRRATVWTRRFKVGNGQEQFWDTNVPGVGEPLDFETIYSWSVVPRNEFGEGPSSPVFTFQTEADKKPPPPPLPPAPPPNLVGISKLSLFNCQIERHTVFVWVRDVTGNGPWGLIQNIPTQFNESGQCPFDDNGILADSVAILTRNGEEGGFACTSGNVYQVSIVDPERPTCDGRNDPTIGNCVVEDQPSFFKFNASGDEVTVMLENGRLSPVPS
jgi:hypothetical protein